MKSCQGGLHCKTEKNQSLSWKPEAVEVCWVWGNKPRGNYSLGFQNSSHNSKGGGRVGGWGAQPQEKCCSCWGRHSGPKSEKCVLKPVISFVASGAPAAWWHLTPAPARAPRDPIKRRLSGHCTDEETQLREVQGVAWGWQLSLSVSHGAELGGGFGK